MNLRMDKAKGLLKKGYKVYEVSEMVGYNNRKRKIASTCSKSSDVR